MRKLILIMIGAVILAGFHFPQEVKEVSPSEAYDLVKKADTYLIDVRTIAEYVFVGHPENAYNLPLQFWNERAQSQVRNRNFLRDIASRFTKEDTLIFICRSGNRSPVAAQMAMNAGYQNVFNVPEGFESRKDEDGYRTVEGWKNRGLPYTYKLEQKYIYSYR
jgi:rhodanese-related sulfurtransferase